MKIKQSFIDRCGEITVKQIKEVIKLSKKPTLFVTLGLMHPKEWEQSSELWQATANVLKIDLSDIYEVEQLPNTLTE